MWAFGIVKFHPVTNGTMRLEAVGQIFQIDRFLLQGSPEPFDEDVVHASAATVHRDTHSGFGQRGDPSRSGEL